LFRQYVVPSYGRFDLAFTHGEGSWLYDVNHRRYLDLGGGIAVCALGHAHPAITEALAEQSRRLIHVSNLYYHEPQGRLAEALVQRLGAGRVFFANSGAEANEGLFKAARKFGHAEGRFEILTTINSFHGRTLAGIAATGQEKVKQGFEPLPSGFRHVPFNDLDAMREALSPATIAVMVEGVQGEGGVNPATPEYLLGLRRLCDEEGLLLLFDAIQCGHYRTGRFQSYQRILEGHQGNKSFQPDGLSMAKSLGGGFPIGAFWLRQPHSELLGAGTHGTTYGGTPLACAVALRVLEVIKSDNLEANARTVGETLKSGLTGLSQRYPAIVRGVRGLGLMLGVQLAPKEDIPAFRDNSKSASIQMVERLHDAGVLTIPAGTGVFRLLPALNLSSSEAEEGLRRIEQVIRQVAG
jgi:acetylornithine aminotransferase/acetylornithine/N-succinyldiaminopimelate aminotransferase